MYNNNAFKVIINYIVSITIASYPYRCILFDPNGIYQLVETYSVGQPWIQYMLKNSL